MKILTLDQCALIASEIAGVRQLWRYEDDGRWTRSGPQVAGRTVFVWLARNRTQHSLPEIADYATNYLGRVGTGHSFAIGYTRAVEKGRDDREWSIYREGPRRVRWSVLEAEAIALAEKHGQDLVTFLPKPRVGPTPGRAAEAPKVQVRRMAWSDEEMAAAARYGR